MPRSKSSAAWLSEHVHDHWVQRARAEGWRSRAAFKLIEIDMRDQLLRPGATVVDLGAAPGGWCQVAKQRIGSQGKIVGVDLLELEPISGVQFVLGDFREEECLGSVQRALDGRRPDLVLSDMAPNISGVAAADQARALHLAEIALDFALTQLQPQGAFLVKTFHGGGFEETRKAMQQAFCEVAVRKPKASRDRSAEVYLLGRRLRTPVR